MDKRIKFDPKLKDFLSQFSWYIDNYGYAVTTWWCPKKKATGGHIKMHRLILMHPNGKVDHKNGNTLDNRWSNLRIASHAQNLWNTNKPKNNTTGFKGVTLDKRKRFKKYRAEIRVNGKRQSSSYYYSAREAHLWYKNMARKLHGEFYNPRMNEEKRRISGSK